MKTDRGKWVTLTKVEIVIGCVVGVWRHLHAKGGGNNDSRGFIGDGWELDIEGACAEIAAYKAIGLYWSPTIDKRRDGTGDGGPFEVRRRSEQWHDHMIKDTDLVKAPHILVCGSYPTFRVVGWIWGYEARRRDDWKDNKNGRGWAWWPPQEDLHDLEEIVVVSPHGSAYAPFYP